MAVAAPGWCRRILRLKVSLYICTGRCAGGRVLGVGKRRKSLGDKGCREFFRVHAGAAQVERCVYLGGRVQGSGFRD
jgi:hypothetical protein